MKKATFDYVFIGLGAANSLLFLEMHRRQMLQLKTFAIIEPDSKNVNDRTFCFWASEEELVNLNLQNLVSYSWQKIKASGIEARDISPLKYYHVQGIDLYNEVKSVLMQYDYEHYSEYLEVSCKLKDKQIQLENILIECNTIFDSRPPKFADAAPHQAHLYQSFYGWKLQFNEAAFNEDCMHMMDFDVPQSGYTQFIYVLPFTVNTALVELTRFGKEKIDASEGKRVLADYLQKRQLNYEILEEEKGVIPMSTAEITNASDCGYISMGSKAGAIKPSTGYAFKRMAAHAKKVAISIENQKDIKPISTAGRYKFYDRLLLKILVNTPHLGKSIFEQLFRRVEMRNILSFLEEKIGFFQELRLLFQLPFAPFLKAAFNEITHHLKYWAKASLSLIAVILLLVFHQLQLDFLIWLILGVGFLLFGLPHGALDHLLDNNKKGGVVDLQFIVKYIVKGILFGFLWWIQSDTALVVFILFSAWHFGQADFYEWRIKKAYKAFFWGMFILLFLFASHFDEFIAIISILQTQYLIAFFESVNGMPIWMLSGICALPILWGGNIFKKWKMYSSILFLLIASNLPLILAFGTFFIFQHSIHGWRHLRSGLKESTWSLWSKAAPFTIMAVVFLALFLIYAQRADGEGWALFFVFLSMISFPHAVSMHDFYLKRKRGEFL